jgi:fission 1 protein
MGETKQTQKQTKIDLDEKLRLSTPSREVLEELAVACAKDPSPDNTFQYATDLEFRVFCVNCLARFLHHPLLYCILCRYAYALSKSNEKSELRYACTILDGLVKEGYEHEVDCMYASATALYLLGEYDQARVSPWLGRNSQQLC